MADAPSFDAADVAEAIFMTLESYLEDGLSEVRVDYGQRSLIGIRESGNATLILDGRSFRLTVREVAR